MKRKIERGKPLEELAKGSLEYTRDEIRRAFEAAFQEPSPYGGMECKWSIVDTFADFIVVNTWRKSDLAPDEFYRVAYQRDGEAYTFAQNEKWEVVELAYQPQTRETSPAPSPTTGEGADLTAAEMMAESKTDKKKRGKRFVETTDAAQIELLESADDNPDGPWRIRAIGNTADVVNANGRIYPAKILAAAVAELKNHLHESAGQGMLRVKPTGESDHPKDKGNRRALLSETIINWDSVDFNGQHILLEGNLLGTLRGKDFRAQVKGGLKPGVSQRGYGDSVFVPKGGKQIEEVTELTITGFDPTLPGDQADADSSVTFLESRDDPQQENEEMTKEELIKFLSEHPELFKGVTKEQVESMNADALKAFEESVRKALGIDAGADLAKELAEAAQAKKEIAETKQAKIVADAISDQTKGLKYGKVMNESFVASIEAARPKTADEVKALVESKRKEYDALASAIKLYGMGYRGNGIEVIGPVLESEAGIPEFARAAHEITESIVRVGDPHVRRHAWADVSKLSVNEAFALQYLERFDKVYGAELRRESKQFEEAETTLDLNLPYSVMRTIAAEALPELVASGVFDFGVTDVSPFRLYFERFVGETGYTTTVSGEEIDLGDADSEGWVALAQQRMNPGSAVVTSSPAGTTYVEGTDYVVDYANGRLMRITGSGIPAAATLLVSYTYTAIRKGENAPIQRGKVQTTYKIMDAKADRLAAQITRETIVFSRSQIGWDAVTRTLVSLVNQIRRKIDQGIFYLALSAALRQASNSGGSWNSSGSDYEVAVRAFGAARSKVAYRYYTPTGIVLSENNGDILANWEGFTQAGSRPDATLNANGFIGKLKGLPVFQSTEFSDGYGLVANREVVAHRIYQPLRLDGPHDAYDPDTLQLLPTQEWYAEEFNVSDTPVPEKAAYITIE
ncbi:hypothetical protein TFLX_03136 [Thermoflexales bacterium]|nr:hypothetical protein TFLX_03136 [Thermoflexales bacterium]